MANFGTSSNITSTPKDKSKDKKSKPTTDKDNLLAKPCAHYVQGEWLLVNPRRNNEGEVINYKEIRKITLEDAEDTDLVPSDWVPSGELSFEVANKQLREEIKDYFENKKQREETFNAIDNSYTGVITKDTTLEEFLSAKDIPIEEKLVNCMLMSIKVMDPNSKKRISLRDAYFAKTEDTDELQNSKIIKQYIDSLDTTAVVKTKGEFPESPDNFVHSIPQKERCDYFTPPSITTNPHEKTNKNTVYLGQLFDDPLHNGQCEEYISAYQSGKYVLPEHREKELSTGVTVLSSDKKGNLAITGAAGTGKTAISSAICAVAQNRLAKEKIPMLAYNVDAQKLINSGSGVFGEWQKKAFNLIQATENSTKGISSWIINLIHNYNIDIEKLDKIIWKETLFGPIPASVPFFQNLMAVGKQLYAAGKIPKTKICWVIDEMHSLTEIGKNGDSTSGFIDMIKPLLENGDFNFVGCTTEDEWSRYFKDNAFKSRFTKLLINELSKKDTFDILKTKSQEIQAKLKKEGHPITITDENLWKMIDVAENYLFNIKRPRGPLDLLDKVVASIKTKNYYGNEEMHNLEIAIAKSKEKIKYLDDESLEYNLLKDDLDLKEKQLDTMNKKLQSNIAQILKSKNYPKITTSEMMKSVAVLVNLNPALLAKSKDEKLAALKDTLDKNIIGHRKVKEKLVDNYVSKLSSINEYRESPYISLLVGVAGTGKTETGIQLANAENVPYKVIACNDLSSPQSDSKLLGVPPGFVNSNDPAELLQFVKANPFGTVILDEVEKMHPSILGKFLQIFEKGVYTDPQDKSIISFRGINFVLTSNALQKDLAENPNMPLSTLKHRLENYSRSSTSISGGMTGGMSMGGMSESDQLFTSALLSRIGNNIYGFGNLSQAELFKIIELKLSNLDKTINNSSLKMNVDYGSPTPAFIKAQEAFENSLPKKSTDSVEKQKEQWWEEHYLEKYEPNHIIYKILDSVMEQNGDGRAVQKTIDEILKRKLEYITIESKSTGEIEEDPLYKKTFKVRVDENDKVTIDVVGLDKKQKINIADRDR